LKARNHFTYVSKNCINDSDAFSHEEATRACPAGTKIHV